MILQCGLPVVSCVGRWRLSGQNKVLHNLYSQKALGPVCRAEVSSELSFAELSFAKLSCAELSWRRAGIKLSSAELSWRRAGS